MGSRSIVCIFSKNFDMRKILLSILLVFGFNISFGADSEWGPTGHRVVGAVASEYLNPDVKMIISELLDGASLALVSTYADEIKSDDRYRQFSPWHYVNFPFDATYENHPKSEKGDIILGIQKCTDVLKDKKASKEDKTFYLKLLVKLHHLH